MKLSILSQIPNHQKCSKKFVLKYDNSEHLFLSKLKIFKNKKFLFFPEEKINYTYEEFFKEYNRISNILLNHNLKKGDKISIIFYNESKFLTIYFAALALGIIVVPINPDLSYNEIDYIFKNSGSKLCVYSDKLKDKIKNSKNYLTSKKFLYSNYKKIKNLVKHYKKKL